MYNAQLLADVAQLVEHLTCNQGVASSIPAVGTKQKKKALDFQGLFFLLQYSPTFLLTSSLQTERSDLEIPGFKVREPELAGSPVAQRAMRPKLIVILSPTFDLVTGIIQ